MIAPLVVLAVLSVVGGYIGVPQALGGANRFDQYLSNVVKPPSEAMPAGEHPGEPAQQAAEENSERTTELIFTGVSVGVAGLGFFLAWLLYYKRPELPDRITARIHGLYGLVKNKYYIDELYGLLFVKPLLAISTHVFWRGVDQGVIDGTVNGAASVSKGIGQGLRHMQSGNIRSYAAWVAAGGAAVIAYMIYLGVR